MAFRHNQYAPVYLFVLTHVSLLTPAGGISDSGNTYVRSALRASVLWAKFNFDILSSNEMFICSLGTMMAAEFRGLALRLTAPAVGLAATIALALLYHIEPDYYYHVLALIGVQPFGYPFLDLQTVISWVDCWQRGLDVYVSNPCGVEGAFFDYPPLWLRFTFLPGEGWTNFLGFGLAVSFFLALAVLPPPRSGRELLPRLIATLSPVTAFAVERGNIDLLMFVIATSTGVLLLGSLRRRVLAYTMVVIGGLLKIYPFLLMVLTLRERPRVFLCVNAAAVTVVLTTGIYLHSEIVKMGANLIIDTNAEGYDVFGAHLLPDFIARRVVAAIHPGFGVYGVVKLTTFLGLFVTMAGWFLCMVRWRDFQMALTRLPDPEKMFLLIGTALIGGCFFAGSNIGYRGIHLLFTLPGLLAMARMEGDVRVRRVVTQGCVLVVALTWVGFFTWDGLFRHPLASWIGQAPGAAVWRSLWFLSQIVWWQVVALFIAILIGGCSTWFESAAGWCCLRWREVVRA